MGDLRVRNFYEQSLKRGFVGNLILLFEMGIFAITQAIARESQSRVSFYLTYAIGLLLIALIEFIFTKWHHARIRRKFKGF